MHALDELHFIQDEEMLYYLSLKTEPRYNYLSLSLQRSPESFIYNIYLFMVYLQRLELPADVES